MNSSTLLLEPKTDMPANHGRTGRSHDSKPVARRTAETMAAQQRDISVSEFFAKNRHLLGFDNPRKAMLTTVKEAVDNSLDACEEAGILPDITVVIEDLQPDRPATAKSSRFRVTVVDNGPGIVKKQVEHIFGRLLYGSKFHRLKMSRGQQGIGISAAGMYGLLTTGKPMVIHTRPHARKEAHHIELAMNTKTNRAEVTRDDETSDFPPSRLGDLTPTTRDLAKKGEFLSPGAYPTGTSVSIELEGKYQRGRGSVDEFLELTAIANPHARIVFLAPSKVASEETEIAEVVLGFGKQSSRSRDREAAVDPASAALPAKSHPDGRGLEVRPSEPPSTTEVGGVTIHPRGTDTLPVETKEIQPHPRGIELGILLQMLKEAEAEKPGYSLFNFLQDRFSRVSSATAGNLCKSIGATSRTKVADIDHKQAEQLFKHLQEAKLPPPPTNCLAPIGVRQLLAGLLKGVRAEFYAASSREADVYRGRPFQIEAAIAFGGDLPADEPARVIRFANRVPLQYQQSACSSFKAVIDANWRNYALQQPKGSPPVAPLVIMIHMASVWVPFTSESKEAIADYDEIRKEMKLALQECGRKLNTYLNRRRRMQREGERRDAFLRYIGEVAKACSAITGADAKELYEALQVQAKRRTAEFDQVLDDEGKVVDDADLAKDEGVVIREELAQASDAAPVPAEPIGETTESAAPRRRRSKPRPESGEAPRAAAPRRTRAAKSAPANSLFGEHEIGPHAANAPPSGSDTTKRKPVKRVIRIGRRKL